MELAEPNQITLSGQISLLYEAANSGDVSVLNSLIQQRPHILHTTSQTIFTETPLHISSLIGHLEFTYKLVTHKPNLALEVDSSQRTALHLASAEGHIDIVKELLRVKNEPCLFPDEEGRIPLHYAAMRGRTKVVQELIKAKAESLSFYHNDGKTVFHLCVTYNHLETLRALVELESSITGELLNFKSTDSAGNTILHLAVMLKRVKVVRYLLSIREIKEIENLKNNIGFTAHDILEKSPKDFEIFEIQHMLSKPEKEGFETGDHSRPPPLESTVVLNHPQNDGRCIENLKYVGNFFKKVFKWTGGLLRHDDKWLGEMRGNLSLVSTVIATITFQALINPPGGFIQQGLSCNPDGGPNVTSSHCDPLNCTTLNDNNRYCPGQALFSSPYLYFKDSQYYLVCITLSFFSSLYVTLLLVSGIFPMKNKVVIWLASIGMCITLTSLAGAYIIAIDIIIPPHLSAGKSIQTICNVSVVTWFTFLELIAVLITLRFLIWVVMKCVKIFNKSRSWERKNACHSFLFVLLRTLVILVTLVICFVLSILICLISFIYHGIFYILVF